jgi:ElaB/YqjD/DUF883 family membrane-anchored ribosome-binding protein
LVQDIVIDADGDQILVDRWVDDNAQVIRPVLHIPQLVHRPVAAAIAPLVQRAVVPTSVLTPSPYPVKAWANLLTGNPFEKKKKFTVFGGASTISKTKFAKTSSSSSSSSSKPVSLPFQSSTLLGIPQLNFSNLSVSGKFGATQPTQSSTPVVTEEMDLTKEEDDDEASEGEDEAGEGEDEAGEDESVLPPTSLKSTVAASLSQFQTFSSNLSPGVMNLRDRLLAKFSHPRNPDDWSWLEVYNHGDPPGMGELAQMIEQAMAALPPLLFQTFVHVNSHLWTQENVSLIFSRGYWPLGATTAACDIVETLLDEDDSSKSVTWIGACDGSGIKFSNDAKRKMSSVTLIDPLPHGGSVTEGWIPTTAQNIIVSSCSLTGVHFLPEQIRDLVAYLKLDGNLVLTDFLDRCRSMDAAFDLLMQLVKQGIGRVVRGNMEGYHIKDRLVDAIVFTRTTEKEIPLPVISARLPSFPVFPAIDNSIHLSLLHIPRASLIIKDPFTTVQLTGQTSIFANGHPGVYIAGPLKLPVPSDLPTAPRVLAQPFYVGASGNVAERGVKHIVTLPQRGTNAALKKFFSKIKEEERAKNAAFGVLFSLHEAHPSYLSALAGGRPITDAIISLFLHIIEQNALGIAKQSNLAISNLTTGAFGQGVGSYASVHGRRGGKTAAVDDLEKLLVVLHSRLAFLPSSMAEDADEQRAALEVEIEVAEAQLKEAQKIKSSQAAGTGDLPQRIDEAQSLLTDLAFDSSTSAETEKARLKVLLKDLKAQLKMAQKIKSSQAAGTGDLPQRIDEAQSLLTDLAFDSSTSAETEKARLKVLLKDLKAQLKMAQKIKSSQAAGTGDLPQRIDEAQSLLTDLAFDSSTSAETEKARLKVLLKDLKAQLKEAQKIKSSQAAGTGDLPQRIDEAQSLLTDLAFDSSTSAETEKARLKVLLKDLKAQLKMAQVIQSSRTAGTRDLPQRIDEAQSLLTDLAFDSSTSAETEKARLKVLLKDLKAQLKMAQVIQSSKSAGTRDLPQRIDEAQSLLTDLAFDSSTSAETEKARLKVLLKDLKAQLKEAQKIKSSQAAGTRDLPQRIDEAQSLLTDLAFDSSTSAETEKARLKVLLKDLKAQLQTAREIKALKTSTNPLTSSKPLSAMTPGQRTTVKKKLLQAQLRALDVDHDHTAIASVKTLEMQLAVAKLKKPKPQTVIVIDQDEKEENGDLGPSPSSDLNLSPSSAVVTESSEALQHFFNQNQYLQNVPVDNDFEIDIVAAPSTVPRINSFPPLVVPPQSFEHAPLDAPGNVEFLHRNSALPHRIIRQRDVSDTKSKELSSGNEIETDSDDKPRPSKMRKM